jgi:hypothetical protein
VPVKSVAFLSFAILTAVAMPSGARAAELFGGLYVHDVKTPLDKAGLEGGMDVMIGWRGDRIGPTPLQPYAFGALNSAGDTSYAAAGLSAKFGDAIYIRPGIGLAVHTGPGRVVPGDNRIDFGSRILFEPELGIGFDASERVSIEASWVHLSHAQLLSRQNPGMDSIGLRLNYKLR